MDMVIERSKWLRGDENTPSMLLSPKSGRMCCLGFYALVCGYKREDIKGRTTPSDLGNPSMFPSTIVIERQDKDVLLSSHKNSAKCDKLMEVNDAPELPERQREQQLTTLFKEINVNVMFID